MAPLTAQDRDQLEEHGIEPAEAERQLSLLREPPSAFQLTRPCRPNDGILVFDETEQTRLRRSFQAAAADGRATKLVPASGAATRLFRTLAALLREDPFPSAEDLSARAAAADPSVLDLRRLREELDRFPFRDQLGRIPARSTATTAACCPPCWPKMASASPASRRP